MQKISALLAFAVFVVCPAHATEPVTSLTVRDHQITVRTVGQTDHVIAVDGSVLTHDTNNERVGLLGPYTGQGHAYVLLAESAGGNACEMQFQAVDLTTSPARLSPVFGDCSPDVHARVSRGTLHATTGDYTGRPSVGSPKTSGETVVFGDGKFTPAR
ncbi:hypothetical protein [Acetobacter sp. UBA5411]|uniref:hypothetical protein n=1 Tax=Acetobacter sp. UBA5411 TaxID=1945905 RepID=UPI0025B9AEF5|nr:hypothetical protein [Acetobacter sp. UBA5411]